MFLIVGIICAVICGVIASAKGRNVVGWVVLGFLLGLIPLIIVACLPNLEEQRRKEAHIADENRRLREQLRQERIKGESFRQHAAARLDAHDRHLNLDTRALGPELAGPDGAAPQLADGQEAGEEEPIWYYVLNGETKGPSKPADISRMIRLQMITRTTLIWSAALAEWQPAGEVKDFTLDFLQAARP